MNRIFLPCLLHRFHNYLIILHSINNDLKSSNNFNKQPKKLDYFIPDFTSALNSAPSLDLTIK